MAHRVRLNFVITEATDRQLVNYCASMGRTPSDVVRQLVIEWLEGDRHLPKPIREHPEGRRTNLQLTTRSREALEAKVRKEGHVSISGTINELLRRFLTCRAPMSGDTITVRLKLPLGTYNQAVSAAQLRGEPVETFIESTLRARLENMVTSLQEES